MPLQYMVSGMAVAATHQYPDETVDVAFNPVGQVVGQFDEGREDLGGDRALGAGVPGGDVRARRHQRGRRQLSSGMTAVLTACSGFLLAVLWMDLIFDVQVLRHRQAGQALPEPVLSSITGYYHRATTTSRPMSHLIALVMLVLLGALAIEVTAGHRSGWLSTCLGGSCRAPDRARGAHGS